MVNPNLIQDYITNDLKHFGIPEEEHNNVFVCKATGYGMVNAGINDGDLLFFKSADSFRDGDIVCVKLSDQLTVRRIFREKTGVRLRRENGNGEDYYESSYELVGKLIGLQRKM